MKEYNKSLKCKDCIHSKSSWLARLTQFSGGFTCSIPESWVQPKYDPVIGKESEGYFSSCGTMRIDKACGPEAKSWSPKTTKLIFLKLREH